MNGMENNRFQPFTLTTRAQIVSRFCGGYWLSCLNLRPCVI